MRGFVEDIVFDIVKLIEEGHYRPDFVLGPVLQRPPGRWVSGTGVDSFPTGSWSLIIARSYVLDDDERTSYQEIAGRKKEDLEEIREALRNALELTAQKLRRKGVRLTVHCADTERERAKICRKLWRGYKPLSRVGIGCLTLIGEESTRVSSDPIKPWPSLDLIEPARALAHWIATHEPKMRDLALLAIRTNVMEMAMEAMPGVSKEEFDKLLSTPSATRLIKYADDLTLLVRAYLRRMVHPDDPPIVETVN